MTGQSWHALYPVLAPGFPGELPAHMLTSGRGMWRRRYQRADGTTHVLDFQSIVICGPDSNIEHIILRVADVTEHIRLQTLVLENERFAASGRLAASLAHEINTPLQALQSYLHLIQVAPETERSVFLTDAMQEMQRVGRIVHQLLDLYHPGNGEPEELDMNVMLERILLLLGKRMREQGVTVERHLADDLPPLSGHSDEVMHALLHVIVNALDAMPDGGVLGVHTAFHALEASLYITITDEGCGIAPEFQARIFEPFVTTKEDRNGLGLAISAQLARQYGGAITVKSHPGVGSTFTIVLPLPRKEPA
jgi:two-component system NtrC family sensor kinase